MSSKETILYGKGDGKGRKETPPEASATPQTEEIETERKPIDVQIGSKKFSVVVSDEDFGVEEIILQLPKERERGNNKRTKKSGKKNE